MPLRIPRSHSASGANPVQALIPAAGFGPALPPYHQRLPPDLHLGAGLLTAAFAAVLAVPRRGGTPEAAAAEQPSAALAGPELRTGT
ncbi:hypothetical protein [Streptomyces sp. NPDC006368]|uniref:hypothetical protein n=1 Tax=Streptomyces sp. NPDC006368 TaxID=3156760 RepID=UPI0033B990A2